MKKECFLSVVWRGFSVILLIAACANEGKAQFPGSAPANSYYGNATGSEAAPKFNPNTSIPGVPVSGGITINVDHASGVDAPYCGAAATGPTACKTIYYAFGQFQTIRKVGPGGAATIQTDCNFTETPPGALLGPIASGSGVVFLIGNQTTPSACAWTSAGWIVDDGAVISLRGFKTINAGSGQSWLTVTKFGLVVYANMDFSTATNGVHIAIGDNGVLVYEGGSYQVGDSGCAPSCMNYHVLNFGGIWEFGGNPTVSVPSALTFNAWYAAAGGGAYTNFFGTPTFTGAGAGSGSTGQQFNVVKNATIPFYGSLPLTFPGNAAGFMANGACVENVCVEGINATFANTPTCAAKYLGAISTINDSNTNTWGATIAGGGANTVQAYCNGTNWTVSGK